MIRRALVVAAAFVLVGGALAASSATGVYAKQDATYGKILTSSTGHTLYYSSGRCAGACTTTWKPLTVAAGARPIAGPGVAASLLGTVKRTDGTTQVTYAGKALYLYSGDKKAGDSHGAGGSWHVVTIAGGGSGSASSSSGSGSNGGGGGAPTTTTSSNCAADPQGYGCM